MSDYTGPGIYEIAPFNGPTMGLSVSDGSKSAGATVVLHPRTPTAEHFQFEIVAAGGKNGKPEIGDREYHILAVHSGLYLALNDDNIITTELRSLRHGSIRWKIGYVGNGAYQINNVDGVKQLAMAGGKGTEGTVLKTGNFTQQPNAQFYLKTV